MPQPLTSDTLSEGMSIPVFVLTAETIKSYTTSPLRALLRSVHRLMQSSGGTEGLRNLVDSDLPKSLKRIFEISSIFGPRVFSLGWFCYAFEADGSNQHDGNFRSQRANFVKHSARVAITPNALLQLGGEHASVVRCTYSVLSSLTPIGHLCNPECHWGGLFEPIWPCLHHVASYRIE